MSTETTTFKQWCLVELMGHNKIAGHCTEQNIAGTNMLRVDVPETASAKAHTKFYNASAIYAIHPISEDVAMELADRFKVAPIQAYDISKLIDAGVTKHVIQLQGKDQGLPDDDEDDEDLFS
jgi:hypothetical protein